MYEEDQQCPEEVVSAARTVEQQQVQSRLYDEEDIDDCNALVPEHVQPGDEEFDPEEGFEVEAILGKKIENGVVKYLLKWQNYSEIYNSWEPEEHLACADLILAYEAERKKARKMKLHDHTQWKKSNFTLHEKKSTKHKVKTQYRGSGKSKFIHENIKKVVYADHGASTSHQGLEFECLNVEEREISHIYADPCSPEKERDEELEDFDFRSHAPPGEIKVAVWGNLDHKPLRILEVGVLLGKKLMYLVQWTKEGELGLVSSELLKAHYPQMIIQFFEKKVDFVD